MSHRVTRTHTLLAFGGLLLATLLRQMASDAATYYQAPDASALAAIYEGLASALPCPGSAGWG